MADSAWKGLRGNFHRACGRVEVVDIGGFPKLWCPDCQVLADFGTHAVKATDAADARLTEAEWLAKHNSQPAVP